MLTKLLPSGLVVALDEALTAYTLATTHVPIPNTALHDILDLLTGGSYAADLDGQNKAMQKHLRGCFELAALWMVKPRLVLRGDAGRDDLVPGPDFSPADAIALYSFFRLGTLRDVETAADQQPDGDAAPDTDVPAVAHGAE